MFPTNHGGVSSNAVGACDKDGNYFILNAASGSPIFPVKETPVPSTNPEWQHPWPTQPISSVESFTPINVHTPYSKNDTAVPEFTPSDHAPPPLCA